MTTKIDELLFTTEQKEKYNGMKRILNVDVVIDNFFTDINNRQSKLSMGLFPKQINIWGLIIAERLYSEKLKYSQLRRFVDALKEIDNLNNWESKKNKISLFPIYLINGYARQKNLKLFSFLLSEIIEKDLIKEPEDFIAMLNLIDSITSYFKVLSEEENTND